MVESELVGEFIGGYGRRPPGGWKKHWELPDANKVECKICGGRWYSPEGLRSHNLAMHPELPLPEGYVRCSKCDAPIHQKGLKRHMKREHG